VISVTTMVPAGLAEALRKAPLCDEKVALAWRIVVGPAVNQASQVHLENGVLIVDVSRPEWQREVRRSAAVIKARLDAFLGEGAVTSVVVRLEGDR
jgi:hypothetical protein